MWKLIVSPEEMATISAIIQNDVFRILVDGNAYIHKSQIEYYALVRAAELTVKQEAAPRAEATISGVSLLLLGIRKYADSIKSPVKQENAYIGHVF